MTLWAHTMVKNEARWLWYSVNSIINHVDKVLLWDTGSTDDTLKVISELKLKFDDKIVFEKRIITSLEDFTVVRQEMLDKTKSDWFMMLDGDEIWYEDSIKKVINNLNDCESVVVPTINLVGDMYHYQDKSAGKYKFGDLEGHYNLRFVKRNINGLHSQGMHGVWGWADITNKMIQDRNSYKFINAPYLHATNLERSRNDSDVIKRSKKFKYEFGLELPKDFYYPESLFKNKPNFIESPWSAISNSYKFRAFFETPFRKIKRKFIKGKVGY